MMASSPKKPSAISLTKSTSPDPRSVSALRAAEPKQSFAVDMNAFGALQDRMSGQRESLASTNQQNTDKKDPVKVV